MTALGGPVRWRGDRDRPVVWARLPSRRRRVSALRLARGAGLVRLWATGKAWIVPEAMAGRPRRNGEARVVRARLEGEWRAYELLVAGLGPRRRDRR